MDPKSRQFILALERPQITDRYIQQISCCTILTNIRLSINGFSREETPSPVIWKNPMAIQLDSKVKCLTIVHAYRTVKTADEPSGLRVCNKLTWFQTIPGHPTNHNLKYLSLGDLTTHTIIKSLVNKFAMKRYLLSESELPVLSTIEKISNTHAKVYRKSTKPSPRWSTKGGKLKLS